MITETLTKLTYEDLLGFPEDDGLRHELIDGDHLVTPSPTTKHQRVSMRLSAKLFHHIESEGAGEVFAAPYDVVLSETDVVQPDLCFLAAEHSDRLANNHLRGAPDLAVEIVSESTRRRDEITKRHLYQRHGVGEYWVIDPVVDTVKVYRLEGGAYRREAELTLEAGDILTSPLFPGLEIPLSQLFA